MAPTVPSARSKPRVRTVLYQWSDRASGVARSKACVVQTTMRVAGLNDLIQQEREWQELVNTLAKLSLDIGPRITPDLERRTVSRAIADDLKKDIEEAEDFVARQKRSSKFMAHPQRMDHIRFIKQKLDSVIKGASLLEISLRMDDLEEVDSPVFAMSPISSFLERPPNPAMLCGRDTQLMEIVRLLQDETPTRIPLLGPGGIGKTTLAAAVMHHPKVVDKFGDQRVFVACETAETADCIIQRLIAIFGLQHDPSARLLILDHLSRMGPLLLVLDNLENAWDSSDRCAVEDLLARLSGITNLSIIITMRGEVRPAGVMWAATCRDPLDTISPDAARRLWHQEGAQDGPRLDELLHMLDGLPLAIHLMARQGQIMQPAEILQACEAECTPFMRTDGTGRLANLQTSIQLSLNSRSMSRTPEAGRLLSALCLLPAGIPKVELQKIFPSISEPHHTCRALLETALAVRTGERLRVLTPVRDFVLANYPPNDKYLAGIRTYMQDLIRRLRHFEVATKSAPGACDTLSTEFGNISSVLLHFWRQPPKPDEVDELQATTCQFATICHLSSRGDCTRLLQEARAKLLVLGHVRGLAECDQRLADILSHQDRYADAIECLESAEELFMSIQDLHGVAQCKRSIGDLLRLQERYEAADAQLQVARSMFIQQGDGLGAAGCTQSLGEVLRMTGDLRTASEMFTEAQQHFNAKGNLLGTAQCKQSMGEVHRTRKQYKLALEFYEAAKATFDELGNRSGAAQCTRSCGDILRMQKRYEEAMKQLATTKHVFDQIGNRLGVAQCKLIAGNVLRSQCRYEEAIAELAGAKNIFSAIQSQLGVADCERSIQPIRMKIDCLESVTAKTSEAPKAFYASPEGFKRHRQLLVRHDYSSLNTLRTGDAKNLTTSSTSLGSRHSFFRR